MLPLGGVGALEHICAQGKAVCGACTRHSNFDCACHAQMGLEERCGSLNLLLQERLEWHSGSAQHRQQAAGIDSLALGGQSDIVKHRPAFVARYKSNVD